MRPERGRATFQGTDAWACRMQVIRHVPQLNEALLAIPLLRDDVAPHRIGFQLAAELEQDS